MTAFSSPPSRSPALVVLPTVGVVCVFLLAATAGAQLDDPGRSASDAVGTEIALPEDSIKAAVPLRAVPAEEETVRQQALSLIPAERHYAGLAATVIARFYDQRGYRPAWEEGGPDPGFHRLLGEELKRHALPELAALDPEVLAGKVLSGPVEARDLAHTVAFCDAALMIRLGAVSPAKLWPDWDSGDTPGSDDRSEEAVLGDLVTATALRPFSMQAAMDTMAPKNWIYRELLKEYPTAREAILKYSGLPPIPNPEEIGPGKPGEIYPASPAIAAHLIDRGYLNMAPEQASLLSAMTPELTGALVAFQNDYGLDPDGIFGQASWRYLNTNAAGRFRSLTINLHRARLMPGKLGDRYLIANLPCAELYLFDENDFHHKTMRIVHGKATPEAQRTKIFRDRMQEVVFGPFWNVPPSIAAKELLPRMQDDWGYLSRNNYELVNSYGASAGTRVSPETLSAVAQGRMLIRQRPGGSNALGYVKFLFPNTFNIYMHDTPAKDFFARANRDHSHGCIRVAKPDELAEWVFAPDGWTLERVRASMANDVNKGVAVKGGINVYITYFTTFPRPAPGGRILYAPGRDVYGYDAADAKTLASVVPWKE